MATVTDFEEAKRRVGEPPNLTELGNSERFLTKYADAVRYCAPWKTFLVWDGRRFVRDESLAVYELAKETVLSMYRDAAAIQDDEARKKLVRWAHRSEDERKLRAMLSLARSDTRIAVLPKDLDADPWLLNCENGVLDLKRAELVPHDRKYLMTKLAPVEYDPAAVCPVWSRFLADTTGGESELERFLQVASGYSLSGDASEEKLFFAYGPTNSGKTTFIEAMRRMLGDYAGVAQFSTFLADFKESTGPRGDIARLAGLRFVETAESRQGAGLSESLIKQVTGGDAVTASFKYRDEFEFVPVFKLWMGSNFAPKAPDDDDALWRRILRVPFAHEVPKPKRDKTVKAQLTSSPRSRAAILAWAVRGLCEYLVDGTLPVTKAVEESTADYRNENDPVRDFFEDCCVFNNGSWAPASELRGEYEKWCQGQGIRFPLSPKGFASRLKGRGCKSEKLAHQRGWRGIGLLDR